MTPDHRTSRRRRYLSLGAFLILALGPSAWAVGGVIAAGLLALAVSGAMTLRAARRRSREAAGDEAGTGQGARRLGVDPAGRPVRVTDRQLAAHALIVGASGAGKTTTMLSILADQIARGAPVVAIDMKGSPAFARSLREAAHAAGRGLRVWSPDGPGLWNPLAHGNATALKDKLIAAERFSEPHYMRAAERYLQTAFQVLHASHPGRATTLDEVVAVMEPRRLAASLRRVPPALGDRVQDYLAGLTPDQLSAVRGVGTRLALLSESSAGRFLTGGDPAREIDLGTALEGGDVVLFSLNSSVYGKLAAQLGGLAIQDVVSATGRRLDRGGEVREALPQATVAIDEFSALGADNVLALLARGREAGVSAIVATQELTDLERAAPGFRDQVLGIIAVKIFHRQDVPASAHTVAQMTGTERVWERTEQIRSPLGPPGSSLGTRRQVERFIVDPNEIKTLRTGQAVIVSKTPSTRIARVRVTPPRVVTGPAAHPPARGVSGAGRDQPAPGVTR